MLFGQPQFLPLLSLTVLPLLVHLLARRRQRVVPFSMTRFLEEAALQMQGRRWLRELILVLLRTGAVLFALLMLLRPYASINLPLPPAPTAIALVIDNSLSMQSVGTLPHSWFRQAMRWCERLAQETRADVAVIAADRTFEPLCTFTNDVQRLRKALAQMRPTFKALDLTAALRTADMLLATRIAAVKQIIIATDLQSEPFRSLRLPSLRHPIVVIDVKPKPQVGNARLTATVHLPLDPNADGSVTATVQNLSHVPLRGMVTLQVARRRIATQPAEFPPQAAKQIAFPLPTWALSAADEQGFVRGQVKWQTQPDNTDVLALDDAMAFAFKAMSKLRIVNAVASGRAFVDAALRAMNIKPIATGFSLHNADVVLTSAPKDRAAVRALTEWMRQGHIAVVIGDDVHSPLWGNLMLSVRPKVASSRQRINWADETSPLLKGLATTLQAVTVQRGISVNFNRSGAKVLATLIDGTPFLLELTTGKGHCLLLTTALDGRQSNLPYSVAFVPLLHRLIIYAAYNGAEIVPQEAEAPPYVQGRQSIVVPQSESDFRLPSRERVHAALRQIDGTLLTVEQPPSQVLAATPLRDLSSLCLALALLCLLTEGVLTAIWWRRR